MEVRPRLKDARAAVYSRRYPLRRFLWTIAGADIDMLASGQVPTSAGIKHAAIGAAIVMTTVTAGAGWYHNFASMLRDSHYSVALAVTGGIGMAALLGTIERLLIVSIPPNITPPGR